MSSTKVYIIILTLGFVISVTLITVAIFASLSSSEQPQVSSVTPTPVPNRTIPKNINPPSLHSIPTIAQDAGGGIDLESPTVVRSLAAINTLAPFMPFKKDLTLSTGLPVSILIPSLDLQSNPWTLTVLIEEIDYNVGPTEPNYTFMKSSFREAAAIVFAWMQEHGVNPNNVLIQWGDRAFVQESAENFLKN